MALQSNFFENCCEKCGHFGCTIIRGKHSHYSLKISYTGEVKKNCISKIYVKQQLRRNKQNIRRSVKCNS